MVKTQEASGEEVLLKHQNRYARVVTMQITPVVSENFTNWYSIVFRLIDVIAAMLLLSLLVLLLPFIWLANRLFDPGPLFYSQVRVGKNGKTYKMYKLRSMVVNAEADGRPQFTLQNDHRITRVGAFLRKTRLDELPQCLNVLIGQMALIGPRPERPEFVEILCQEDANYKNRLLIKPGITGWAQVKYKYTDNLADGLEKMKYDLHYLQTRNVKMDSEIIWRTIKLVINREGT